MTVVILRVRFGVVINSSQFIRVLTVNKLIINAFLLVFSVTAIPAANAGIITGSFSSPNVFGSSQGDPIDIDNVSLAINTVAGFLVRTDVDTSSSGILVGLRDDTGKTDEVTLFHVGSNGSDAKVFAFGETISGSPGSGSTGSEYFVFDSVNSLAPTGYLGFQGVLSGVLTYYGWLEVSSTATDITFISWGYEDSGAAIAAGDVGSTGAVPEPASIAIVGLASIAMLGRRKRRQ